MVASPTISVMIPTKNRFHSLKRALDSLRTQTFRDFEVVIVDGGSTDETKNLVRDYSDSLNIQWSEKTGGLIAQMNVAFELARGPYVVRTDDDVIFSSRWLQEIVDTFEAYPEIGGVTGPTIIPIEYQGSRDLFFYQDRLQNGNLLWRLLGRIYENYFMEGFPDRVSHWCKAGCFTLGTNYEKCLSYPLQDVNNLEACNWAVRRNLLERIGGFDSVFGGIGEYHEPDAAFKISKLGHRLVFNPKAMLNHCPSVEGFFKERPNSYQRMINFLIFYLRHLRPDSADKLFRFILYILFLNCFYFYQAIRKKQINQLGAILGTVVGIIKGLSEKSEPAGRVASSAK